MVTTNYIGEPMTVGRLIAELSEFRPDTPVLTATDEEGNEFHNFLQVSEDRAVVIIWPTNTRRSTETPTDAVKGARELWALQEEAR
jgi:hypothetical protein